MNIFRRLPHLLLCLLPLAATAGEPSEVLSYDVTYRGVFSMGADMPIADVTLATTRAADDGPFAQTRLEATSAAYPLVESLYPMRYRLRSWADPDGSLLAFETYEKTDNLRHRLHLRDGSRKGVKRLDLTQDANGGRALASLDEGRLPDGVPAAGDGLSDRLGLLQLVRSKPLHAGADYRFAVTNGKKRFDYRVQVEKAESIRLGETTLRAWKLRFDGERIKRSGEREVAHRPFYIWLSQSPGHVPLRADSRHPIGLFRLTLKDPARLQQLAALAAG